MHAMVTVLGSDAPVAATVVRVAPAVDPTTLLGLVRIALASAEGIPVGTSATARISIGQRPGVRVPASALRRSLVGEDEVVVCDGGTAHVRKVAIGNRGDQGVEIKDGVKAGERVVVDHVLGLQDEQPIIDPGQGPRQGPHQATAGKADDDKADDDQKAGKSGAAKTTSPENEAGDRTGDKAGDEKDGKK
jgi:hypothetical protein